MNYLDNMFSRLPNTKEMQGIKQEMLANMEDKYHELIEAGKSEHEAIGIVISEFGNIDELIEVLGVVPESNQKPVPTLTTTEINDYLQTNKKSGILVGVGVGLIILGAALLILITQLMEDGYIQVFEGRMVDVIGLIPLLLFVTIAVGMFIIADSMMKKFSFTQSDFHIQLHEKERLEQENQQFQQTHVRTTITGVALCILAPMILIISSVFHDNASVYGVVLLLLMVTIAVFLFIYYGRIKEGYNTLLHLEEHAIPKKVQKKEDKVIGAVASIIWPLAVIVFLISGLVYHQWHINWIVFPITGLLFAMFSGAYSIWKREG